MRKTKKIIQSVALIAFILFVGLGTYAHIFLDTNQTTVQPIMYSSFISEIKQNKDKEMKVVESEDGTVTLQVEGENVIYTSQEPATNDLSTYVEKYKIDYERGEKQKNIIDYLSSAIMFIIPIVFFIMIVSYLRNANKTMRKAETLSKSNAKNGEIPNIKMEDVGGLSPETLMEIDSMIDTFSNREAAEKYDIRPLKGAIFHGPPGTGKTLLAKAVANKLQANFYSISGSAFVEMYVGVGAKRVRDLFNEARKNSPALIFIDEIDAVAGKRGGMNRNEERENTLNELLTQLDGIHSNEKVLVLAATNRLDMLDDAFIRPGRFDLKIMIDLPDLEGRREIIRIHTKKKPLSNEVKERLDEIAKDTYGHSGAEIESLFLTAANHAFSLKKDEIDMDDINYAIDRMLLGSSGRKLDKDETKKRVAYHEAGHALIGALVKPGSIRKATIVPRGQALGFVAHSPDELHLSTSSELINRIKMILAGGVAEMKIFGEHSVGVGGDVQQARDLIEKMVDLGMGDDDFVLSFSDKAKQEKMKTIYEKALNGCKKLIEEHFDRFEALTQLLYEKETLEGKEVEEIVYGTKESV